MPKHTLTFPEPTERKEGEEVDPLFRLEFDGRPVALPLVTEIVQSIGYLRRVRDLDAEDDRRTFALLALAVEDDETILRQLDYLTNDQWLELMTKWGEFTGASLGE